MRQTLALLAGVLLLCGQALAGGQKWEKKLDSDVRFKVIHDSGLIVVGTSTTAYGFNPETGEQKWKIDGLMKNYDPEMVKPQPGSEYLVYVYKKGLMDVFPAVRCLNILTGEQVWEWDTGDSSMPPNIAAQIAALLGREAPSAEEGAFLVPSGYPTPITSVVMDEARDQFLLGTSAVSVGVGKKYMNPLLKKEGINAKPKTFDQGAIIAVDRKTGKMRWVAVAPDQTGKVKTKLTYPWSAPQIVGDRVVMDGAGCHVFNLSDGSLVSAAPFDRTNGKDVNAATVVADGVAYVTSAGQLTAVDIATGQIRWQTKPDKNVAYTEVYVVGDKVVAKRGGTFTDAKGKPKTFAYGLDVLDKNSGQPAFDSAKLHKPKDRQIAEMTNLLVDGNTVYYATQHSLRAFDLGKLDYQYVVALGETQGDQFDGVKSISGGNGKLYVLMKQTTKAFNPADGAELWSKTFSPPKVSGFALAMLNALSAMEAQQRANNSMTGRAKYKVYSQASFYQGRSAATGEYNYVMAKENDKPTVVGVNLETGNDDRRATMDKKEADYIVDERWGLLVNVEKKETLQVYDLNN
jgi:outer membrane protein assembly factor BamB